MPRHPDLPDWRDASAYEPLAQAERASFAWEWLRRQQAYRDHALQSGVDERRSRLLELSPEDSEASRWGLHRFEDPTRSFAFARPLWKSARYPLVLHAVAERCARDGNAFELMDHQHLARLTSSGGYQRLLLSDGHRSIRLDSRGASLLGGPVRLQYEVCGFMSAKAPLLVIRRLSFLVLDGAFSPGLHPPDRRARRRILALRAYDALQEGAEQRAIANELLSERAAEKRWRVSSPSLRSQVQRLVHEARKIADGGFWKLLG